MSPRERILSVGVDRGGWNDLLAAIRSRARSGEGGAVCFANVHMLHRASRDDRLRAALDAAFRVVPDGTPLAWWLSRTGAPQERLEGMSVFPRLLENAAAEGIPVGFFGADEATLEAVRAKARRELPGLRIVETVAPGWGDPPFPDDEASVERLRVSGARLVFVALGCPKQEIWMGLHASHLSAVSLGVGNALRTWLGWEKRPPRWVRRMGLEWFVRFAQDPVRLGPRYLLSNAWFLVQVGRSLWRRRGPNAAR